MLGLSCLMSETRLLRIGLLAEFSARLLVVRELVRFTLRMWESLGLECARVVLIVLVVFMLLDSA